MTDERLLEVLADARSLGFLGPGPVDTHLASAAVFRTALADRHPGTVADLGSGGGVPGLALAAWFTESHFVLIDAAERRTSFLESAVERLDLKDRVSVVRGRAEEIGRDDAYRYRFDAVVARSFGAPGVVAECASPLLRIGGALVVSDPPGGAQRWDTPARAELGLGPPRSVPGPLAVTVMEQLRSCPERFPRRTGVPAKRPLF